MNKADFLNALKKELKRLKPSEIQRNISYYDEIISDMTEHHLTEEEAVSRIGSPKDAAREILDAAAPDDFRRKDPVGIMLILASAILTIISLYFVWETHISMFFQIDSGTAVSIIGGADGPTSIYLAGRISPPIPFYFITGAVLVRTVVYFLIRRRKK